MNIRADVTTPTCVMQVMDPTGHTEISWNASSSDEVEVAKVAFEELVKKGYQAFRVRGSSRQGERLHEFDRTAERILMIPQLNGG